MVRAVPLLLAIAIAVAPGRARGGDGELAALTAGLPACEAGRAHCLGIQLHVAVAADGGAPVADAAWLAAQLAAANAQFAPLDVGFQVVGSAALPAGAGRIATRGERDAVSGGRLGGAVIHVFVTGRLDDVDQPGAVIRGVTWRARGSARYVILSTAAPDRVLAHELGHVFGLPHSRHAISIMNKAPRTAPPIEQRRFADPEIAAMRPILLGLLREQRLADLGR